MEEIDLTNSRWSPEDEIYLLSVVEGIRENYSEADLDEELKISGYSMEDLKDPNKIVLFMKILNEKYPD
jgi:hypothetical protein